MSFAYANNYMNYQDRGSYRQFMSQPEHFETEPITSAVAHDRRMTGIPETEYEVEEVADVAPDIFEFDIDKVDDDVYKLGVVVEQHPDGDEISRDMRKLHHLMGIYQTQSRRSERGEVARELMHTLAMVKNKLGLFDKPVIEVEDRGGKVIPMPSDHAKNVPLEEPGYDELGKTG